MTAPTIGSRVVVVGFGRTGQGVARVLDDLGVALLAIDDAPSPSARAAAARLGVELLATPAEPALSNLVSGVELVVVSPGVPPRHPIFAAAAGVELVSEIELAQRLCDKEIVAITGTNGKTTVTALVAAMLEASGRRTRAVGNFGPTLIEAVREPELDLLVAEVSSFQLALTSTFHPSVATFLNFAEDHLDWHRDLTDYLAAKARIFANQDASDRAIANAGDPATLAAARSGRGALWTFGAREADFRLDADRLVGPSGEVLAVLGDLPRALPHDVDNALAACATALGAGAETAQLAGALRGFELLPHRITPVGEIDGVTYYDDSKATTPSATIAALAGFSSSVLICGGRNKGLDLGEIRDWLDAHRAHLVRGVVAIGEAADELVGVFAGYPLERADSMAQAVAAAGALARPGDAVLLSPGCASFDWYRDYEARGEDFAHCVAAARAAAVGGGRG